MVEVIYKPANGGYAWLQELDPAHFLEFGSRDLRLERTGIHAVVSVAMNGTALAWSNFNIERDEDRVRLANSAYTHIASNGVAAAYPKNFLKNALDRFCFGRWDAHVSG